MPGATLTYHWAQGTDHCPDCAQTYAYELEARCVDCDAPMCPFCVVMVRGHRRCPTCAGGHH